MFQIIVVNGNTGRETVIATVNTSAEVVAMRNEWRGMVVAGSSDWLKVNER